MKQFFATLILLFCCTTPILAQTSSNSLSGKLYFGGCASFGGVSKVIGYGGEFGVTANKNGSTLAYAGLEIGQIGSSGNAPSYNNFDYPATDYTLAGSYRTNGEQLYGLHAGLVLFNHLFIGAVVTYSFSDTVQLVRSNGTGWFYKHNSGTNTYFGVGPDVRYLYDTHFMFSTGWTFRRGFKAGLDYQL